MTDKRIKESCPFCGTKAEEIQIKTLITGENKIICPKCKATFDYWTSKQSAIDTWNCRYR